MLAKLIKENDFDKRLFDVQMLKALRILIGMQMLLIKHDKNESGLDGLAARKKLNRAFIKLKKWA